MPPGLYYTHYSGVTLGNPQSKKAPQFIPTIETSSNTGLAEPSLKEAWTNIIEEHLLKQKPTKQVYVRSGLPTLPRRIVEKMLNWEYINFNELLPFCDPGSEEEQSLTQTPEQLMFFPGLGLLQHGHQVNTHSCSGEAALSHTWLSWPPMAITSCAYFNVILKANREYTGSMLSYYDVNYRQKAETTLNMDWSAIDTSLFSQCFTGRARKAQGCTNCSSLKHELAECLRKKGKRPANKDIKGLYPKQQKQRPNVCFNWNYNRPCHTTPCHMNASSAF